MSAHRASLHPGTIDPTLLSYLVEHAPDALLLLADDGQVLAANLAAEQLLGAGSYEGDRFEFSLAPGGPRELYLVNADGQPRIGEMTLRRLEAGPASYLLARIRDVTGERHRSRWLRTRAFRDPLTGLYSRAGFVHSARRQLLLAERTGRHAILFFADVVGLRDTNERYGLKAGDELLRTVAALLTRSFRDSDILARLGGDEFVVLATELTSGPYDVEERLGGLVEAYNRDRDGAPPLRLATGIARFDPREPSPLELLLVRAAEQARPPGGDPDDSLLRPLPLLIEYT